MCISKSRSIFISAFSSCQEREKEIEKKYEQKKKANPVFHFKFQHIHVKDICGGIFGWQKWSFNLANLKKKFLEVGKVILKEDSLHIGISKIQHF